VKIFGYLHPKLELLFLSALIELYAFLYFIEKRRIIEELRHDEVKKYPKLFQVVTQRCSTQEKFKVCLIAGQRCEILRLKIFDFVSLVNNQNFPFDLF